MHIHSFEIENIRSIESLAWEAPEDQAAGWHVIIGDNASGKSTVLRAVALALVGATDAAALRQNWGTWLRRGTRRGKTAVHLSFDNRHDKFSKAGQLLKNRYAACGFALVGGQRRVKLQSLKFRNQDPQRHVWGGRAGWFSAGYGPFRRFTGGDRELEKIFYSNPRLGRHLSLFGEAVALSECLEWLQTLQFRALEADGDEALLLESVRTFINESGALPHGARLDKITSKAVEIIDGNGCRLPAEELSDGYRSVLSMTFELIRQLVTTYGADAVFDRADSTRVAVPGVVLIDEVDAHLHPSWQRRIGFWFRERFPALQFLVTTHSPFVCQAAETGSVFRLAAPGSEESSEMLEGPALDRLLYGDVLDAYSGEQFGVVRRSDAGLGHLERLAALNQKELRARLTKKERAERDRLRAGLPTAAHLTQMKSRDAKA